MTAFQTSLKMRDFLKTIAFSKSVKECGNAISSCLTFSALQTDFGVKAIATGRATCKSIFCPSCRQKKMLLRTSEIQAVIDSWRKNYKNVTMITFTAPHSKHISPKLFFGSSRSRKGLSGAITLFKERSFWRDNVESFVSVLESTFGKNGVHAHYHVVVATNGPIDDLFLEILTEWRKACADAGLGRPSLKNGIDIQSKAQKISQYLSKWSVHDEVSGQFVKSAKNGNYTLRQIEEQAKNGVAWAVHTLSNYYKFMYRRKSITYSRDCSEVRQAHKKEKNWSLVPIFAVSHSDKSTQVEEKLVCTLLDESDFDASVLEILSDRFTLILPDVDVSCTPESRQAEKFFQDKMSEKFNNARALLRPISNA